MTQVELIANLSLRSQLAGPMKTPTTRIHGIKVRTLMKVTERQAVRSDPARKPMEEEVQDPMKKVQKGQAKRPQKGPWKGP